ncbi:hypothetical protein NIES2100_04850 [Calothrix sp. NIES-2100]|uniref:ribbon-helix-helix domain-containing protein n=1 Tax=Calothrix sp. NIES-2100 TaxID=1954172 RepID=UPI000B5FBE93|nr:hypothetical protein NIES2100_04850 [Calothrix sp. NIES-2100]
MGGKPLGKNIGFYIPEEILSRIDNTVKSTNSKNRSELLKFIIVNWLDNNGY